MAFNPLDLIPDPTLGLIDKGNDALNPDQKAKLSAILARNGWGAASSTKNQMARSVVQRESGGKPDAENPSGATGLFQMMTPLHCGSYGTPKAPNDCVKWLKDPDNNAKAAHALFLTAGWTPWVSSGPIPPPRTSWDPEITTDKDTLAGGVGEVAGAVVSPFASILAAGVDLIGALLSADTWFRIGKSLMGFSFVTIGSFVMVYIIANKASGGAVSRTAKKVATTTVTKGAVK